jgi:arabinose-5-phosphate isomerase
MLMISWRGTLMSDEAILQEGRRVIAAESAALQRTWQGLDARFCAAVKAVAACRGKVVTAAVGKSGFIARKLASTLSSLSIPAVFIHPTEGLHGDLGMLASDDLIIGISHSGNTEELLSFLLTAKLRFQAQLIAIVGSRGGSLDGLADIVLETGVVEEACALGLAPTTSSTAALALGDALAVAVSRLKGVQPKDFAVLHPAGELGRRLYTPIAAIMRRDFPTVDAGQPLREVVLHMTSGGIGLVVVEDRHHGRIGIITDGDVRRGVQHGDRWLELKAGEVMSSPPKAIGVEALSMDALAKMEGEKITSLVVLDGSGAVCGIVHIHDILRHGLGL